MQHNLHENEPNIYHFNIGRLREGRRNGGEHGSKNQQRGQVHRHDGLKEVILEVVGDVDDDDEDEGRDILGKHVAHDSTRKDNIQKNSFIWVT